jgi:uncharacterized protein (DUF1810 family)
LSGSAVPAHDLTRFVDAQRDVYEQALSEIRSGRKRTHWMWFVFPQIAGLGSSAASQHFAIRDRTEAQAYLDDPILGARLLECAQALMDLDAGSASDVFGYPDDIKLRSSMTLFSELAGPASVFAQVIDTYFNGQSDERTVKLLAK